MIFVNNIDKSVHKRIFRASTSEFHQDGKCISFFESDIGAELLDYDIFENIDHMRGHRLDVYADGKDLRGLPEFYLTNLNLFDVIPDSLIYLSGYAKNLVIEYMDDPLGHPASEKPRYRFISREVKIIVRTELDMDRWKYLKSGTSVEDLHTFFETLGLDIDHTKAIKLIFHHASFELFNHMADPQPQWGWMYYVNGGDSFDSGSYLIRNHDI